MGPQTFAIATTRDEHPKYPETVEARTECKISASLAAGGPRNLETDTLSRPNSRDNVIESIGYSPSQAAGYFVRSSSRVSSFLPSSASPIILFSTQEVVVSGSLSKTVGDIGTRSSWVGRVSACVIWPSGSGSDTSKIGGHIGGEARFGTGEAAAEVC